MLMIPYEKYKDSGVAWIGDVPEHWEVKRLKYVANNLNYKRIPLSSEQRSGIEKIYDYYGASGVIDQVDDFLFDGDFILVGEDGANLITRSVPLAFKASGKFWVNNHAHILQPKNGNIEFFTYYLESIDYSIWISGSAQPKLTSENLMNIHVGFPPLPRADASNLHD
jgi:type I restriction enzyme S subunit